MSTPPRALFTGLVDDAAMFPPGNASATEAIAGHLRYRSAWFADLIGPLLVPAAAVPAFAAAHAAAGSPPLAVVLIGATTTPVEVPAAVTVVGYEVRVDDLPLPTVPDGRSLAAEIHPTDAGDRVLRAVAERRSLGHSVVGKFRTGGTTADAFPTEREVADVIARAAAVPVPLKLTAGLHHAVRCTDAPTGFEQHGFLNVIVAISRALADSDSDSEATADVSDLEQALASRDADALVAEVRGFDERRVRAVRERFVSFGCCGVEDPVADLVHLELVSPDVEVTR